MRAYVCIRGGLGIRSESMGDLVPTIHVHDDLLKIIGVQGHDMWRMRQLKLHEAYLDHAGHTWVCVNAAQPTYASLPQNTFAPSRAPWDNGKLPWD